MLNGLVTQDSYPGTTNIGSRSALPVTQSWSFTTRSCRVAKRTGARTGIQEAWRQSVSFYSTLNPPGDLGTSLTSCLSFPFWEMRKII